MKVNIVARKFEVSESFKSTISKKLKKLDKFFSEETEANVTLTRSKNGDRVEITVFYKSNIFRAESEFDDMLSALDKAVSIIERQIRKNKTKLEKRLRDGAFDDSTAAQSPSYAELITRRKTHKIGVMSEEEAILQMELSDHEFFLFRNDISGEINVVYKRKENEYGIIIPE